MPLRALTRKPRTCTCYHDPREPTEEERAATREAERAALNGLSDEQRRGLFGLADDSAPIPQFYNKNTNQCPDGGACYEAGPRHKISKGDGTFRRGRKHFAHCPQEMALQARKKLKCVAEE